MADKVLVVDDDQAIRDLLGAFLVADGYEVTTAKNGVEAIELAKKKRPHVILMDVKMPGVDGIEACKLLKSDDKTKAIPVIMITGYQDRDVEAYLEGADDFVNKPFDKLEISFRVKSILRIRHLTGELERAMAYVEELQKKPH